MDNESRDGEHSSKDVTVVISSSTSADWKLNNIFVQSCQDYYRYYQTRLWAL